MNTDVLTSSMEVPGRTCRILYLVGQLGLGGLERQLFYLLQTMDRQRYKPVVAVWRYCESEPFVHEIRALRVPLLCVGNTLSRLGKLMAFRRMVSRLQPEVVHSYTFYTNIAAWWATLGSTTIPVGSIRNNFLFDRRSTGMILGRLCSRWPIAQISNNLAAKNAIECCALFKPHRVYVVRNGLDLSRFSPQPCRGKVTLLAVGNLCARKRWDRLIRVVALLSGKGLRFQVRHVGDGPLREELAALARRLHVDSVFRFLGPRNDIPELLADSAFLVHTAEDEGCPNVVMEAMACGRAVVATAAGDVPYLVEDGKTGYVVSQRDEAMLAERIATLIADYELCRRMGEAGRAKAEREFELDHLVVETLGAYKSAGWKDA